MIAIKDLSITRAIRTHSISKEELTSHLLKNYSVFDLAECCAEYIMEGGVVKDQQITVSQEEYDRLMGMFKIRGIRVLSDGVIEKESRGRKPKKVKEEELVKAMDREIFNKEG